MAKKNRFTTEQIIAAVKGSGGIIASIAKTLECDWHTAAKYINGNERIKQAVESETETLLDRAEYELSKLIAIGDFQAIKFYLSTKGKSRGYREGKDVDITSGGNAITKIEVEYVKQRNDSENPTA